MCVRVCAFCSHWCECLNHERLYLPRTGLYSRMQKLPMVKTIHGCFLAPKHIPTAKGNGDDSELEEETDDDDFDDFELGDDNVSSGSGGPQRTAVNCVRLKRTTGKCAVFISSLFYFVSAVCFTLLSFRMSELVTHKLTVIICWVVWVGTGFGSVAVHLMESFIFYWNFM